MSEIPIEVSASPQFHAVLCAVMASYTLICVLDHERWMKEWGDDHEAVAVLHLRMPILSAAAVMGIGGFAAVDMVSMSSIRLNNAEVHPTALWTSLAAIMAVLSILAMLCVARRDAFAGVNRVQCLKEVILKRHTLTEIKRHKGLGKRAAYFSKLDNIVFAGVIMAVGGFSVWMLHMVALAGEFVLVWKAWPITFLVVSTLLFSVLSSWLLFRVLVWKPAHEPLRPVCAGFIGCFVWTTTFLGQRYGVEFQYPGDRSPTTRYGWKLSGGPHYGQWLLLSVLFFAVLTQYAIALELRLAYCGLQNANLDLQMLAGMSGGEENSRRSSRYNRNASKRMSSLASPRSPASRSSAKITTTGAAAAGGGKTGPLSPSLTMAMTAVQLKPPATVASAVARMGSSIGLAPAQMSRNIRVQPVDADKVYGVSADRKPPDEEVIDPEQPTKAQEGWNSVRNAAGQSPMEAKGASKPEQPDKQEVV